MKTVQIRRMLSTFWAAQDGVAGVEYALVAALIFGAVVVSVGSLSDNVKALYDHVAVKVVSAMS